MASIRKQGKRWQAIIRRKHNGKTITRSKMFPKKVLADAWARKIEEELAKNLYVNSATSETPLEDLLIKYGKDYSPRYPYRLSPIVHLCTWCKIVRSGDHAA